MKNSKSYLIIILLFFSGLLFAQESGKTEVKEKKYDTWSLSLHAGTMQFYGDISYNTFFPGSRKGEELSLCGHAAVHKQFTRYFGANVQFLLGKLASEEEKQNEYFNTDLFNYNVNAHVSMSNLFFPDKQDKWLNYYFIVGLGMTHYRTIRKTLDNDIYINSMGYKDNGQTKDKYVRESCATIGCGLKFNLSDRIDLVLETTIKSTPRDNMDALYVHLSELDKYGYLTLGLAYKFGKNKNSLEWDAKDKTEQIADALNNTNNTMDSLSILINNMNNNLTILLGERDAENGPDADQDSVPDYRDLELNTGSGLPVDVHGVTIPNCCDPASPNYKAAKAGAGAGVFATGVGDALYSVFFGLNSTYVTPLNHERISIAANMLKRHPEMKYELVGSTCSLASNQYNIDLSKRRVETVKNILIKEYGIDVGRLVIKYDGEDKPLNITDKNKYVNRRVDIFIVK